MRIKRYKRKAFIPPSLMGLTPKERLACFEFKKDFNFRLSLQRADYPLLSENDTLLLQNKLSPFIIKYLQEDGTEPGVTRNRVLQEMALLAFYNPKDLYDKEGRPIPLEDLGDLARVVQGVIRSSMGEIIDYKLYPRDMALAKYGQALGMFEDKKQSLPPMKFEINIPIPPREEKRAIELVKDDRERTSIPIYRIANDSGVS